MSNINKINVNGVPYDIEDTIARSTYVHRQDVASNTWNIQHELNKYPSVTIVDSSGNVVIGDISYSNTDSLIITFSSAFTGKAYLN